MEINKEVNILYTNWRGETRLRRIIPQEIVFIKNEWHKEEQWCLVALDLEKQAQRTFACKDIKSWFLK
jgi:predicted DNA-binding transcriptional regulator YafY